jgi:transcriptional regulator with XRE-family HTH domain
MKFFNKKNAKSQNTVAKRGRLPSLRRIREFLRLNQTEMAEILDVTQAMVSMVESGKARAGRKLRRRISEVATQTAA